jgi:major membrane immunogen (membrane-anchored lipoprotein)
MMKQFSRLLVAVLIAALAFTAFGCANEEEAPAAAQSAPAAPTETRTAAPAGDYEDGIYFAREDGFGSSGWKSVATVVVEDGKIVDADWNGAHMSAGYDKKKVAKDGDYNMVAFGNAQAEWDVQAERAEAYLLEVQDPTAIAYTDDEGHTDDIAGVSIHVVGFFDLVEEALAAGPVGRGPYEDGHYYAADPEFGSTGWRNSADLTVINGYIVAANWNGAHREGGVDKKTSSATGEYGMVANGGAQAEWHEQAKAAEEYLIETQDPTAIAYTDDEGHTDDIAGVSIHVAGFFDLVERALEAGPAALGPYEDGVYHAEADEFASSGWKGTVDMTVYNGRIMAVNWSAVNEAGEDKKEASINGDYGMVAKGGAQAEWHEQAYAAEAFLLETQDPAAITYNADGYTDAISGVSVHVSEFAALVEKALEAGPVEN